MDWLFIRCFVLLFDISDESTWSLEFKIVNVVFCNKSGI